MVTVAKKRDSRAFSSGRGTYRALVRGGRKSHNVRKTAAAQRTRHSATNDLLYRVFSIALDRDDASVINRNAVPLDLRTFRTRTAASIRFYDCVIQQTGPAITATDRTECVRTRHGSICWLGFSDWAKRRNADVNCFNAFIAYIYIYIYIYKRRPPSDIAQVHPMTIRCSLELHSRDEFGTRLLHRLSNTYEASLFLAKFRLYVASA